jgi:enterochelin esterase-like enzyme
MLIVAMISLSSIAFAGGKVDKTSFYSNALKGTRDVNVYLPEGYNPGECYS